MARDQDAMPGDARCTHSLFRECELDFRFGPIKVSVKYEHLDVYSLDMFHFGLEKGTVTQEKIQDRVKERLVSMRSNILEMFGFVAARLETLFGFMDKGMEEVKRLSQIDLS